MRPRKPWFRADRDACYVQHNGKQVLLAKGKANRAEAQAAYHKLMLVSGETPPKADNLAVATLCDQFLDFSLAHHTPSTYENYRHFLQAFCKGLGLLNASELKPFHVTRWVDGKKAWNGAKRHAVIAMKRAFSWAEQQGLIAVNQLRPIKAPRAKTRDRVLTADERKLIFGAIQDEAFRHFLEALLGTGCRPSEVAGVTAANVNLELGVWILPQHKTAKKTGKPRVVYLSPAMLALTKDQMAKHPTGPLFPNTRGKPFRHNAWRCRFRRLRERFPELKGVVAYSCRHSYATNALVNGVGQRADQGRIRDRLAAPTNKGHRPVEQARVRKQDHDAQYEHAKLVLSGIAAGNRQGFPVVKPGIQKHAPDPTGEREQQHGRKDGQVELMPDLIVFQHSQERQPVELDPER